MRQERKMGECEESREYEVEVIRGRSFKALRRAERNYEDEDYDGAVFDAEQAVQLYLKSIILELSGEIPRTHDVRRLLSYVGSLLNVEEDVKCFIRDRRLQLIALEDAYINAGYRPKEYSKEDAEAFIQLAREVIGFVRRKYERYIRGISQDL